MHDWNPIHLKSARALRAIRKESSHHLPFHERGRIEGAAESRSLIATRRSSRRFNTTLQKILRGQKVAWETLKLKIEPSSHETDSTRAGRAGADVFVFIVRGHGMLELFLGYWPMTQRNKTLGYHYSCTRGDAKISHHPFFMLIFRWP